MPALSSSPIVAALDHPDVDLDEVIDERGVEPVALSLLDALAAVPDPRAARGVRHGVLAMLVVSACAVLAGARSFVAIAEYAHDEANRIILDRTGFGPIVPHESTIRRVLQALDPAALEAALRSWVLAHLTARRPEAGIPRREHRRVLALDGKTARGARRADGSQTHLVSVLDQASGAVLGQVEVDARAPAEVAVDAEVDVDIEVAAEVDAEHEGTAVTAAGTVAGEDTSDGGTGRAGTRAKGGELGAFTRLLDPLDLSDVLITADALHTQRAHACYLHDRGGHYLMTVKANQPTLLRRLRALPWATIGVAARTRGRGHGRAETRAISVVSLAPCPDGGGEFFPHAAQAIKLVRRRRSLTGRKWTTVTVYAITSLTPVEADPALLARWVQGHWSIENRLHWVRDVTFDEDRSQVRTAHGPQVMAALRNITVTAARLAGFTNIAAALRHHAHDPRRSLATFKIR